MTGRVGPKLPFVPEQAMLNTGFFTVQPPKTMWAEDYPWEHEIRVALPFGYAESAKSYPVLWVTDNALEEALPVIGPRELIVVSTGATRTEGGVGSPRRAYDFYPCEDIYPPGPSGDFLRGRDTARVSAVKGGGAARFLDFLLDEVRPELSSQYRMDSHDHALEGFSAGGWFVTYALFTRPGAFAKYIAGAPSLSFCNNLIWEIEEQFAATHDDLQGQIFFGAGDREMTVEFYFEVFSSMARMVERLSLRNYPSLNITVKIFPGESHMTGRPFVISSAVQALWGDSVLWRG